MQQFYCRCRVLCNKKSIFLLQLCIGINRPWLQFVAWSILSDTKELCLAGDNYGGKRWSAIVWAKNPTRWRPSAGVCGWSDVCWQWQHHQVIFCINSPTLCWHRWSRFLILHRLTTCLENLEMSGNLTAVGVISGILLKTGKCQGKNLVREKLPPYRYLVGVCYVCALLHFYPCHWQ